MADLAQAGEMVEQGGEGEAWRAKLRSFTRMARVNLQAASQELTTPLASGPSTSSGDLEQGGSTASGISSEWSSWASRAAERVRQQAAEAADHAQHGLAQGLERAQTLDWSEQAKSVQRSATASFERVATGVQDGVSRGVERAKSVDWADQAASLQNNVSQSFQGAAGRASAAAGQLQESMGDSEVLRKAKENATTAANSARGALNVAGERVSGVATLAMSPVKLGQFIGIFMLGLFFIMLSFNFLPALLIKPQNFAVLFTIGSMTLMGSFVFLNGYTAFMAALMQRNKLPFSGAYVVGLVGTLVSTLLLRSFILTAVFALMQAVALLYFTASYIPGGTAVLNSIRNWGGRSARSLVMG
eukprot:TRINITY_DN7903_c0_g2_i1.p1 TRINITY_DN7903_c0_g2~~TRINITY_DN7903_c0_g2_i1.p1  ORF type:complete len:359 (+),score=58.62 TRINITY_DN7903_c0_g2_i1:110-1186(+)